MGTSSVDGTAMVWSVEDFHCFLTLSGHGSAVGSVSFSPEGLSVLTTSADGTARIWDSRTGQCTQVLQGHDSTVTTGMWSSDGFSVATASADGTARIWSLECSDACAGMPLKGHFGVVTAVEFGPVSGRRRNIVC